MQFALFYFYCHYFGEKLQTSEKNLMKTRKKIHLITGNFEIWVKPNKLSSAND